MMLNAINHQIRKSAFPLLLTSCLAMGGFVGVGSVNGQEIVESQNTVLPKTDPIEPGLVELLQKFRELEAGMDAPETREQALAELQSMAKPAVVRKLAESLSAVDGHDDQARAENQFKMRVFDALEEYGVPAAPAIIRATRLQILPYRCSEFKYVGRLQSHLKEHPECWKSLLPILDEQDEAIRIWAIGLGAALMAAEPQVVERWFEIVMNKEEKPMVRRRAVEALRGAPTLSETQMDALIPLLAHTENAADRYLQFGTQVALNHHHEIAIPFLKNALQQNNEATLVGVLECLEKMGPNAMPVRKKIRQLFQSENRNVRIAAATCYWQVTQRPGPIVKVLEIELKGEPDDRLLGLCATLGPKSAAVANQVARQIERTRQDKEFNGRTLTALSSMGEAAIQHVDLLDACLQDSPSQWMAAVAVARTKIANAPGPAARHLASQIERQMKDSPLKEGRNRTDVNRLLNGLRLMGPHAAEALPVVERVVRDWDGSSWVPIRALQSMGAEALPALKRLGDDENLSDQTRESAAKAYNRSLRQQAATAGSGSVNDS